MKITCNDYDIYIDDQEALVEFLMAKDYSSYIVLVDENTSQHCLPWLKANYADIHFEVIQITSGEEFKSIESCGFIWNQIIECGGDRHGLCINLGGGVIGDMGGFCAATFMRGMDFIQIPTTLLSMVDASVGGKLGIDFEGFKNYIGLFKNPNGVFVFPHFLETLEERQMRSGFAEIIKHALIKDESYWEKLLAIELGEKQDWTDLITKSIQIKKEVVEKDPTEKGLRKILNFGHTIGHAIESSLLDTDNALLHGEAIAAGMICEAFISYQSKKIDEETYHSIKTMIRSHYEDLFPLILNTDDIVAYCQSDKKNEGSKIKMALLDGIGMSSYDHEIAAPSILTSLTEIT